MLIKKLFEKTGKDDLAEILPHPELYIHGGVNFAPYREQFRSFSSQPLHFYQTYNASEGFFGIQDQKEEGDLLLLTDHGIFYEFIPMKNFEQASPPTKILGEVERDTDYAIVISSNAGLWRYIVGDTVKFTSTHPYRLQVTGRTQHFINAFGEELMVANAEQAISEACEKTGARVKDYTAAPIYFNQSERGGHEWWVEFEESPASISEFRDQLDRALKSANSDYAAKRQKSIALKEPVIQIVSNGTFHRWLESKGKLGGQNKVPRLANHRQYVEELAQFTSQKKD
jgi:hypothetical protein